MKEKFKFVRNLEPSEIEDAEIWCLQKAQWESFPAEVTKLKVGEFLDKSSKLFKLSPYFDNESGLIKVKGRIDATPYVEKDLKRPVILIRDSYLVTLLIDDFHRHFNHQNHETIVNEMRQMFWIPELRVAVKMVVSRCQKCKNKRAQPQVPEMSPLPDCRLALHEDPFTYTGLDFFGPVMVTVGRRQEKRYGALFTCLTVRAVHVELVSRMDTDSCIFAVRNFMCRRGPPKEIWSDNGSNLHGAENELKTALQNVDCQLLERKGQLVVPGDRVTRWKFITPRAPHMGGAWERHVQSIKKCLYACLKERAPREDLLRNLLIEAENVVNSRPLTYQPMDPDLNEALTPNHLLRMSGKILVSPTVGQKEEYGRKTWRFSQQLANEFWKRFVLEYIPELTRRTKWYEDQKPIQLGDVVIIVDEQAPRNHWEKGIVDQLHVGVDGKVRSATVRTAKTLRKRPVAKLAILDVQRN